MFSILLIIFLMVYLLIPAYEIIKDYTLKNIEKKKKKRNLKRILIQKDIETEIENEIKKERQLNN